ncbi:YciI family protein [Rugosimonospora acidiphila]|uniref:YciI family protein n=1 Tax=Rugosimonospora acidiphila TaxID=556531 RepID=A0ABP9RQR5_9ACTN
MAQYLILIYENEAAYLEPSPDLWQTVMQAHGRFAEQVTEKGGQILGTNALEPTTTATSIRSDIVTDGPFVETKEALGGYYLVEANDLDHALDIAKLCPAPHGGVEVRPVMDTSGGA